MVSELRRGEEEALAKRWNMICYVSGKFIPRAYRDNVIQLYRFIYLVDCIVDAEKPVVSEYKHLRSAWESAKQDPYQVTAGDDISIAVRNVARIAKEEDFNDRWVDTYLDCREDDLYGRTVCKTLDDTRRYIHGTGEMIALMMCKAMHLDPITYPAACMEARAMQYLNLIRDIAKHNRLGRCYIPQDDLEKYGLPDLHVETALANRESFKKCIQKQLDRCATWQALGKEDLNYLPKICKVSLLTAIEMYDWTAAAIARDPFVVYHHQVRPTQERVLMAGLRNMLLV